MNFITEISLLRTPQALTTGYAIGTWGVAQGVVYNRKGVWLLWQLRG